MALSLLTGFVGIALLAWAAEAQGVTEAWVQRYDMNVRTNGPGTTAGLAVDAGGSVYLLGISQRDYLVEGYEIQDWAIVKYSSGGVPVWTNLYGAVDYGGWPRAITVDSSGNVLVTGTEYGWAANYCATVKYASDGATLWARNAGSGEGHALAVDSSGNVCVAASADNGLLTIKYSSTGDTLWTKRYRGSGSDYDVPIAVATDAEDNVVVAGGSRTANENYAVIIKYSSGGALLWTTTYRGLLMSPSLMALDSGNNVLVTGDFYVRGGSPHDFLTIKYSSEGVPRWTNRYDGPAHGSDWPYAVAVDSSDNVYITGESETTGSGMDFATIKYTSAGAPVWTNFYTGPGNGWDTPLAMALDASGNAFVTGQSPYSGGDVSVCATVAYSSSGVPLWTNVCNRPENSIRYGQAVAVDPDGCALVAGPSIGSDGKLELALVKYVTTLVITRQPLSCTNAVGTTASFSVEVAGGTPLSYQWRKGEAELTDGGNISGATTVNLLIADVQLTDAGGYSVVVTNAHGRATSAVAQLTVVAPPSGGRLTDLTYSPVTAFSFVFRDGTVGQSYRIQRASSLAEGSWVDWQSFTYSEPLGLMDMGALTTTNRFYRAISP